jgi:hypothetical protein
MKFLTIKFLALIVLLSLGNNVCAYMWSFSNHTTKTIDIKFGLMGAAGWWEGTVEPNSKFDFAFGGWWAGYCMWGFEWTERGKNEWKLANPVYLPVEVYNETVKNAAKIGSGFDTFLCNAFWAVKVINKGQCPSVFASIIEWIGGLIARSACANREFEILEDANGAIEFFTYLH